MYESPRPTLLMLPGTLCDSRIFAAQRRHLRGQANVVCANYQGLKNRKQWLQRLLNRLPKQFYVAGFSLGGLVALELLRIAGKRVQGVAMIASNAQAASIQSKRKSALLRRMWLGRGAGAVARSLKPTYFHHELKRKQHKSLVSKMALQTPRNSAFEQFSWAAQRASGLQTLRDSTCALIAVSGLNDRLCPTAWQEAMKTAQPNMEWVAFERCGHFLPLEAPAKLSHTLKTWITSQTRQELAQLT